MVAQQLREKADSPIKGAGNTLSKKVLLTCFLKDVFAETDADREKPRTQEQTFQHDLTRRTYQATILDLTESIVNHPDDKLE